MIAFLTIYEYNTPKDSRQDPQETKQMMVMVLIVAPARRSNSPC